MAGKFDEAKALALVEKYLGSIPKPTRKLDATYTEEPPQDGERAVTLRRVGAVGSAGVAYHVPAASHADWAPLSLLGGIISQAPNGRLYKALVESKMATSATRRTRITRTIPACSSPRLPARRKRSTRCATRW